MSEEVKGTVRKRLSESDIAVLMKIRGMGENTFTPLKNTNPLVYRPRTTIDEWSEILKARGIVEQKIPSEALKLINRINKNVSLTKEQKIKTISKHLGIKIDKVIEWSSGLKNPISSSQFSYAKNRLFKKSKRYIISSAQNASPVNVAFLRNIEAYAKHINAEIIIIATRYRNPTSVWHTSGEYWDKPVEEYLTASRITLHSQLEVLGDLKIQATSPNPTNGIELFGDDKSCIVGAPKIEMRSLPVLPNHNQKFLYSTGSVTYPSFTESVAGGKAAEHHSFGFAIVEVESENVVHVRNVSALKDGSFNDLIFRVENETVSKEDVPSMVWGDSHFAQKDLVVTNAFRKVCTDLGIKESILHDVYDSISLNIHNIKNPIEQSRLAADGRDCMESELQSMINELKWFEENMKKTIVVRSNHDDFLDRAMVSVDWRSNIKNAKTFIKLLYLTLDGKCPDGIIPYIIKLNFKSVRALSVEESYVRHNVELGMHGHKGANGSKGSAKQLAKLPTKSIIGHSHSPTITGGCYQVGISCGMQHGYNKGLSGWAYASCLLNERGKRQMIVLNKWTKTYTTLF